MWKLRGNQNNPYERVKNCFAFEETDPPPVWDWIRNDAVIEHFSGRHLTIENGREAISVGTGCNQVGNEIPPS